MKKDNGAFIILLAIPLIIALIFIFNRDLLIPAGYELGVDGAVISRNLYVLFILYLITKVAFHFSGRSKKD